MRYGSVITLLLVVLFVVYIIAIISFEQAFVGHNAILEEDGSIHEGEDDSEVYNSIVVGIYNAGYLYHESHDHGINKELVIELFSRLDIKYKIEIMPRVRISSMIEEGSLPVGVSTIETAERAEFSYFVPYFSEKNEVLIRKSANVKTEEELFKNKDLKVGIVRGYYYGEYYTKLIEELRKEHMLVEAKDTEQLYQMLKDDWIQLTFNNATSYLFYIEFNDIKDIEIYDWAPFEDRLVRSLVFSKKYFTQEDVEVFQKTIEEMKRDGTIYSLFSTYLSDEEIERSCEF